MNKIFINGLSAKIGGGKTYIFNLLSNLNDVFDEIYVVCPDKTILPSDRRIIYLDAKFANKNIFFRMIWEVFYLPLLLWILKVNVLFVPGGMDFTISSFGVRKVTMFRNMLPFDDVLLSNMNMKIRFKNKILKYLMMRTMRSAQKVIFISYYAKYKIENLINKKQSPVIYHGIPSNFIQDNNAGDKKYILYVSRFEFYKNHLNLIKAYVALPEKIKNEYNLVLVGEFMEPVVEDCKLYIQDSNTYNSIIMLDKVPYEKLTKFYREASLFVFLSSCENCPNIMLEAIGSGLPIVSSSTEPMPEFAKNSARYVDPQQVDEIRDSILEVLTSETVAQKLRNNSKELRKFYCWNNTAIETWKILSNIGEFDVQK